MPPANKSQTRKKQTKAKTSAKRPQAARAPKKLMTEGTGDGNKPPNKTSSINLVTEEKSDNQAMPPTDKSQPRKKQKKAKTFVKRPQAARALKKFTTEGTGDGNEPPNKTSLENLETEEKSDNQVTEDKITMAMVFKLNAQNTNYDDQNNTQWLLKAGFTEQEITTELCNHFKKSFSYKFRKFISPTNIPEEDQPWHKHWIKKLDLTPDLLKFLPKTERLFPTSKEDATYNFFERIGRTGIKQSKLQGDNGRLKDSKTINQYKTFNNFFKVSGIPRDLGVNLDYTIIHLLFTDDDTSVNFQDPHTDYPYHITRRNLIDRIRLSWTAHLPITPEGSWITMWFGPGVGYTLHIPFGPVLLLHSDVIHGGGVPHIDVQTASKQFRRLHFYLATQDQAATPGLIYKLNYDNETRLLDTCYQAKRSFN